MDTDRGRPGEHALRHEEPLAWTFHRGTARWLFNSAPAGPAPAQLPGREHPHAPWTPLPTAPLPEVPLADAIRGRVSCRAFSTEPVTLAEVSTLVQASYGVLGHSAADGFTMLDRPVPSGGGLYPLELTLLVRDVTGLQPGVHHVVPAANGLEQLREGVLPKTLMTYLFMGQAWVADAAVVVLVSAVFHRSLAKYGDRGYRYLLLEAGHVVQNVNLCATALGLGSVNVGGFYDDEVAGLARLDTEVEAVLYACAVGRPSEPGGDRMALRALGSSQ